MSNLVTAGVEHEGVRRYTHAQTYNIRKTTFLVVTMVDLRSNMTD